MASTMEQLKYTTYYDLLGIDPNAAPGDIQEAHKMATILLDNHFTAKSKNLTQLKRNIDAAFTTLHDHDYRKIYNQNWVDYKAKLARLEQTINTLQAEKQASLEVQDRLQQKIQELQREYKKLKEEKSTPTVIEKTKIQKEIVEDERYRHRYYWAIAVIVFLLWLFLNYVFK